MNATNAVRYEQEIPDIFQAMTGVHAAMESHGFDRKLQHLVRLRASQINGCAFCIKMHIREAREDGESNDRIDRVIVWNHVNDFTQAEKAALAWTEALTAIDGKTDLGALRAKLREHYSEEQIGVLTANIAVINFWNRFQVSTH